MSAASTNGTRRTGPRSLTGSAGARRQAAVILETLCGARTTQEAAEAMGIALPRYYVLETRALAGLIEALEPRKRGRQVTPERELEKAQEEVARLEGELRRYQALYRTSQRALGVTALPDAKPGAKKKAQAKTRKRRRKPRGAAVVASLTEEPKAKEGAES